MDPQNVGDIISVLKDEFYFQQLVDRMVFSASIGAGLFASGAAAFTWGAWRFLKFDADELWIGGVAFCALVAFMFLWGTADCVVNIFYPEAAVIHDTLGHL